MMILLARQIFIALLELYYNIHVHILATSNKRIQCLSGQQYLEVVPVYCTQLLLLNTIACATTKCCNRHLHAPGLALHAKHSAHTDIDTAICAKVPQVYYYEHFY